MSVSKELRRFLLAQGGITIDQIAEGQISELEDWEQGFIWFGRSGTERARTFGQATDIPEQQYFDLEIYHPDADVVEAHVNVIHKLDCYSGTFGNGTVQGILVDSQSDDYIPRVQFEDSEGLEASFLSIEIRSYTAP